ncbi:MULTISPECIES: hypothetical protein [unclassified Mesorhizobium]|uniref:hypothetical protein n=1 Tax=unclassified Mesorhizobium TaxID=325217 RepID=UPI00241790F4|nr:MULTISPECIES: hypothetical protein [unclassified Mesorhizobium]MDG4901387.1 hypothetical protein [Mesorhizobium sp. WSM4962]MDG4918875.1 hypothetical protein [Mesorhizobium sp. WSM4989]
MQSTKTKVTRNKAEGAENAPDARLAALVRLLARDLARRHLENPLSASPEDAYLPDSAPKDAP